MADDAALFIEACKSHLKIDISENDIDLCKCLGKAQRDRPRKLLISLKKKKCAERLSILEKGHLLGKCSDNHFSSIFINADKTRHQLELEYNLCCELCSRIAAENLT